jgi:hypothetical protein
MHGVKKRSFFLKKCVKKYVILLNILKQGTKGNDFITPFFLRFFLKIRCKVPDIFFVVTFCLRYKLGHKSFTFFVIMLQQLIETVLIKKSALHDFGNINFFLP